MANTLVGISGWRYPPWRGWFYPKDLPQRRELEFVGARFDSVEVNGSFYSLLNPTSVRAWVEQTPDDFCFAVKGSRYITHMKRLGDVDAALANFFASGLLAFGHKLGPLLWQLPPSLRFDADRLDRFLRRLPHTHARAGALARRHDDRVTGRAVLTPVHRGALRHVLEVRHESFLQPAALRLLERHQISLCIADTAGQFPAPDVLTSNFVYVRLHGATKLYESGYTPASLRAWAARVRTWVDGGRDVYVYFDNDAKIRAPFDARRLRALLDGRPLPPLPRGLGRAGEPARARGPR